MRQLVVLLKFIFENRPLVDAIGGREADISHHFSEIFRFSHNGTGFSLGHRVSWGAKGQQPYLQAKKKPRKCEAGLLGFD